MVETDKSSIIDEMIEELETGLKQGRKQIEGYRHLKKLSEVDKISKDQAEEVMKLTCYGHLAGCCGPEKECPTQLCVCEALGLDPEELFQVKKDAVDALLRRKLK